MFGIGMQEILLILFIALLLLGPKKLPEIARALGKGINEFRRAFEEARSQIENVKEDVKKLPELNGEKTSGGKENTSSGENHTTPMSG